ncbi:MAG: hypothetical protein ABSC91_01155 [Candidatus Bathyarchaeia archaeon]|jgi:hypothetical protein
MGRRAEFAVRAKFSFSLGVVVEVVEAVGGASKIRSEISKNWLVDVSELRDEVFKAEGDKNKFWQGAREWAQYRGGAQ